MKTNISIHRSLITIVLCGVAFGLTAMEPQRLGFRLGEIHNSYPFNVKMTLAGHEDADFTNEETRVLNKTISEGESIIFETLDGYNTIYKITIEAGQVAITEYEPRTGMQRIKNKRMQPLLPVYNILLNRMGIPIVTNKDLKERRYGVI